MHKMVMAVLVSLVLGSGNIAFAAHPLITDDAGTQGKGKWQFEFVGEYDYDKTDGIIARSFTAPTIPAITFGIIDTVDLAVGLSYLHTETEGGGTTSRANGISDVSLQVKWRFYDKDGLSFAIKPGLALPSGDENKGLGNGRVSYSIFLVTTKDTAPWAFHLNLGYLRNEYRLTADEEANRKNIWHASLASEVKVVKNLRAVANIGIETNSDITSNADPVFVLGGLIYSLTENLDIDVGYKYGLTKPETDHTVLAGVTIRL